jgi:hypothetical protein
MIEQTNCCGFKEIDGLNDNTAKESLNQVCEDFFNGEDAAFLFFTGVSKKRYGQNFKRLITKLKLGKIIETEAKRNPNSGNKIKAWIWSVNKPKFKQYAKQHQINISE